MKKALVLTLIAISSTAFASGPKFDLSKNFTNTSTITIIRVDNVNKTCQEESKRRGNGGFGFAVDGCSFWKGNVCTVLLPNQTDEETLGHEVRHCFQGAFH